MTNYHTLKPTSWAVSLLSVLTFFTINSVGIAVADTATVKSPDTIYQLSDLDKASAALLQVITPTTPIIMSDISGLSNQSGLYLAESSVVAKATLSPGITIDGLACNILHTPSGKHRWSILQYDLSTDTDNQKAVFVADEDRTIQSVSCSADGSQVLMAIQDSENGDSEIYLIDQTNDEILQLTDNDTEDLDVSMSQDGKVISWQGRLVDDRQAVFVRTIAEGGSYSDVALGSKFPFTQPSLSANGEWLVMVNERNLLDHIVRYQVSTGDYVIVEKINSRRYEVTAPSISNDGTKVLWLKVDVGQALMLTDLSTQTNDIILQSSHSEGYGLDHPMLSGDGEAVIYSVNTPTKRQTFLRVLRSESMIRLGKVLWPESHYLGSQLNVAVDVVTYNVAVSTEDGSVSIFPESADGYLVGDTVTLTAVADSGYVFSGWVGVDQCEQEPVCTFIVKEENLSVSAVFEELKLFKLTITATNGSVIVSPESDIGYLAGSMVSLTAAANSGYIFSGWVGVDECDQEPVCTFIVKEENLSVSAVFEELQLFKLIITATNGSVIVSPESDIGYLAGSMISLTAMPNVGYRFVSWLDTDQCKAFYTCNFVMPSKNVEMMAVFNEVIFSEVPVATGKLNDTGITQCADGTTNGLSCPAVGYSGQDAQHGRDVNYNDDSDGHAGFSYTKLDLNGNTLLANAENWSCVKDNVTGLIWEVKQGGNGTVGDEGLHDVDDRFNWYTTDASNDGGQAGYQDRYGAICYGYESGTTASYCNTQAYAARVNTQSLCGAIDWRIPTPRELQSLVRHDISYPSPAITTEYFPNAIRRYYWSSSPNANISDSAWSIGFGEGDTHGVWSKTNQFYVRLVRGE